MNVVCLIQSDPMESHRAVEGIRIALGLASGEHEVTVILTGDAPRLLGPDMEENGVDGDLAQKFLPVLTTFVPTIFVDETSAVDFSESDYATATLSRDEIARRVAAASRLLVF